MYRSGTHSRHILIPDSPNKKFNKTSSPSDLQKPEVSSWIYPEQISDSINPKDGGISSRQDSDEDPHA